MSSRLSRLLRIAPSQELRPASFETFLRAEEAEDLAAEQAQSIGHDPELSAHDEAVFLLHTAAEVEHSLMVQYLYAAYSLGGEQVPADKKVLVNKWKGQIIQIAKEEMGHLASVQNLLHLIGGSLNLEREDLPFRHELYPFRFKLEPLTKDSLAKYVFAEMPPNLTGDDIEEIKRRANSANMQNPLNHVGLLYQALASVFNRKNADGTYALTDLLADSVSYQAGDDWKDTNFVLEQVRTRGEATALIEAVAKQGEGLTGTENMEESHYLRFLAIYKAFPEEGDWQPSLKLPVNPNTTDSPDSDQSLEKDLKQGRITNRKTRFWAQLLNIRYRRLLMCVFHALHLKSNVTSDSENRALLRDSAFEEMSTNVREISKILITLPLHKDNSVVCTPAGPPFELPYSLSLPADKRNRWRLQRDVTIASQMLTKKILEDPDLNQQQKQFLQQLTEQDTRDLTTANEKIAQPSPDAPDTPPDNPLGEPNMNRFTEIKTILENAVESNDISAHGNFWRNQTRDEFIRFEFRGQKLIVQKAGGTFDENESALIKALEGRAPFGRDTGTSGAQFRRMPAGFPPVPPDKIEIIRQWIKDGCPDDIVTPPA